MEFNKPYLNESLNTATQIEKKRLNDGVAELKEYLHTRLGHAYWDNCVKILNTIEKSAHNLKSNADTALNIQTHYGKIMKDIDDLRKITDKIQEDTKQNG